MAAGMRAAGVVVVSLLLATGARVARAQPGMTNPPPTGAGPSTTPAAPSSPPPSTTATAPAPTEDDPAEPLRFGLGADAHLVLGALIHTNIALRAEVILAPHDSLVVRGGVGKVQWFDSEYDDPIYRERFVRVGYRLAATHVFGGAEVGRSWYQAHWDIVDQMPAHDGEWFAETTFTALIGLRLGPVDLGIDYTKGTESFAQWGVFIGGGYRQPRRR
jgi:hypothetical protein